MQQEKKRRFPTLQDMAVLCDRAVQILELDWQEYKALGR